MACYADAVDAIYSDIDKLLSTSFKDIVKDIDQMDKKRDVSLIPVYEGNKQSLDDVTNSLDDFSNLDLGVEDNSVESIQVKWTDLKKLLKKIKTPELRGKLTFKSKAPEFDVEKPEYSEDLFSFDLLAKLHSIVGEWVKKDGDDIGIPLALENALKARSAARASDIASMCFDDESMRWGGWTFNERPAILRQASDYRQRINREQIRYFSINREQTLLETRRLAAGMSNELEKLEAEINENYKARNLDVDIFLNDFGLKEFTALMELFKSHVMLYQVINETTAAIYEQDEKAYKAYLDYTVTTHQLNLTAYKFEQQRAIFNMGTVLRQLSETMKAYSTAAEFDKNLLVRTPLSNASSLTSSVYSAINLASHVSASGNANSSNSIGTSISTSVDGDAVIIDLDC